MNRAAHVLQGFGAARGDRVAVLSENRPDYLELELACAKLGAILACQNWRLAPPELRHCIGLVAPRLLVDRVKYMIKSGGENIYPAEIERVLLADPRLADAVVVRRPDARWGKEIVFVPLAELPRSTTGKIQRHEVEAWLRGRPA